MKIKVCGMRDKFNILELAKLNPDYMGFIFYPKSKRYAAEILDKNTLKNLPSNISKVGVFVNNTVDEVAKIMSEYHLDVVQLHGDETPKMCAAIKDFGYPVVKAFGVNADFDFNELENFKPHCDYFLFDTKGKSYGGHGVTFDWSILNKYDQSKPFFLSGGLDADNIHQVKELSSLNIHAVDVNSKFEVEPGLKNIELLEKSVFQASLS